MIRWLQHSLHVRLRTLFCWGLLFCAVSAEMVAAEVVIVDSNKHPESFELAQSISLYCPPCGTLQYMDMQRDLAIGRQIVAELRAREQAGTLEVVIALGPLAARLAGRELRRTPVFYLMREPVPDDMPQGSHVTALAGPPSVTMQLTAFKALVPDMRRVGLLLRRSTAAPVYDELVAAAKELGVGLSFFYVDRPEDVSPGLRQAIGETDGLMFLRDSMVINGDTIRFILRLTLENRVPTFTYSPELVAMGMGAAVHLDQRKLARHVGAVVTARLNGEQSAPNTAEPFVLEINASALGNRPAQAATRILGMEVVER